MKKSNFLKKTIITLYKFTLFTILLALFIFPFSSSYSGLTYLTRTSVITSGAFIIVLLLMLNVYGNFEIGEKKSKPVVFSMFINIFITDFVALFVLKVMGVHETQSLSLDLITLFRVILTQYITIYVFTYLGNYMYFEFVEPIKVIVVHDNSEEICKITNYLKRHQKQYSVLGVYNTNDVSGINVYEADQIYMMGMPFKQLSYVCRSNYMNEVSVIYDANISNTLGGSTHTTVIDDILMYEFKSKKISEYQLFAKRLIDIIVSAIALVVFSPVFLVLAIAIKVDDNGPVFYKQNRITQGGRVFEIVKFRSMKMNSGDRPATKNDDRITKVGHYIRKFRMDEIPQFINILKGDMSVVGPRPESEALSNEITKEFPEFSYRLKVKAGLTGYAQIFGKYNTSPNRKLLLDLEYIENYTVIQDIKLILQTIIVFVKKDSTEGFDSDENNIH